MTVMLLQHTPLARYKLPPPTPPNKNPAAVLARIPSEQASCNNQAMRYYRLWIYTCNAVLLVSVLGFAVVAGRVVVADPRRYAIPGLALYQPSFIYAYFALATQSGLLQIVGCLGALRLNERLLNVYWLLLLVLLFGDAIVGVVWVFRFDKICSDLRPTLKQRLAAEYGVDADFTALWDALQRDYKCCGVEGAPDFPNRSSVGGQEGWHGQGGVPESCCKYPDQGAERRNGLAPSALRAEHLPASSENESLSHVISSSRAPRPPRPPSRDPCRENDASETPYHTSGCAETLLTWLRHSADILFVLGYCVIAFIKLCFLGILRYEIREMIQKIKVLQGELRTPQLLLTDADPCSATAAASAINSPAAPLLAGANHRRHENNNGSVVTAGSAVPERLLAPPPPPDSLQATPNHRHHHHHLQNDAADSDTNSNCALLIADEAAKPRSNGNNNSYEVHELHELNRLLARHRAQI